MTSPAANPKIAVQKVADPPQARKFTFEEYCAYEDGTDNRYELVQGYLQLMAPPVGWHILVCEFLVYVFNQLFQKTGTPLWAVREVGVRMNENTCRIVDICVNWQQHWQTMSQPGEKGIFLLDRTPLLVVEATSTNEKEDYQVKYQEYASAGIPEYWIVNRRREHLWVCNSASAGSPYRYREFVKGERVVSTVLPQLELIVDAILDPPTVRQLLDLDQAQQTTTAAERDAFKMELEQLKALMKEKGLDTLL